MRNKQDAGQDVRNVCGMRADTQHNALTLAPAKVNLTLHITGKRQTGYHNLDSLVAFADIGDLISVRRAKGENTKRLSVSGPYSKALPDNSQNIIFRALKLLNGQDKLTVSLVKNLPIASGLGGGSSDAAITLKRATELLGRALPSREALIALGADVPACLEARALRMRGVGEIIDPLDFELPQMGVVLVNPCIDVSTRTIFSQLTSYENPSMISPLPRFSDPIELAGWLGAQRNDLEEVAISYAPAIGDVLAALRGTRDCLLARMSGSGASCFGLYRDSETAKVAAKNIVQSAPKWWVRACQFVRATI